MSLVGVSGFRQGEGRIYWRREAGVGMGRKAQGSGAAGDTM